MYTDIRKRIDLGAKDVKLAMLHYLLGLEQLLLVPEKSFPSNCVHAIGVKGTAPAASRLDFSVSTNFFTSSYNTAKFSDGTFFHVQFL